MNKLKTEKYMIQEKKSVLFRMATPLVDLLFPYIT